MRTLHLFAGAGGGILADMLLGHVPIGAVEWDEYPCNVLEARQRDGCLPRFPVFHMDVREFNRRVAGRYRGVVDILAAGFPCQPFSVAGKQQGENDERNMWPDTIEVIRRVRPKFAFLENVPGLLSNGYIRRIFGDLAEAGYDARWCVLGAGHLGGWHLRERLWVVASNDRIKRVLWKRKTEIYRKQDVPWFQDVGGVEDLRGRSDIPLPLLRGIRNGEPHYVDRIKAIGN